jgi:hypothetical protein
MIVQALCKWYGVACSVLPTVSPTPTKILAVGSILQEARGNDVVWGAGFNSKGRINYPPGSNISFRAVRGPLSRSVLLDQRCDCPPVYGDPGLLFPMLFDRQIRIRRGELERAAESLGTKLPHTIVLPNLNDDRFLPDYSGLADEEYTVLRPNLDPITVAAYISASVRVVSSSLHGLVFADAYGRSSTRLVSQYEPEFKYTDYYLGTGREPSIAYPNIRSALGGIPAAELNWNPRLLLDAFPLAHKSDRENLIIKAFPLQRGQSFLVSNIKTGHSPFTSGWSQPADGAIWTENEWNDFSVIGPTSSDHKLTLWLKVGTLTRGKGDFARLRVVFENRQITTHEIRRNQPGKRIEIPLPPISRTGEINLRFKIENASSPKKFGLSDDNRELGIWVSEFGLI